ncbi:hypothetical protein I4U23_025476 [Adineta vaga]|nr:hypothetical protein I4U23_025476 [Adineta vaga]
MSIFLDEMDFCRSDGRQRLSVTLDAGYVSITPISIDQLTKTLGLHGRKLVCVICAILTLFLISCINLTCLLWFMYRLNWSLFDSNRSKLFHYDQLNEQIIFFKQMTCQDLIYINKSDHSTQVDIISNKHIDISGDQNSILFDDDQILFNTDNFYFNNHTVVDFANLESFKFDHEIKTRVHINRLNSQYIHGKHLNITATNQLTVSNIQHARILSSMVVLEANRNNRRSVLRFNNFRRNEEKSFDRQQKISNGNIRFRSDLIYFDLPRFPLLNTNYRSESGIYRLCICNTTHLFLRSLAHQPCPRC